MLNTPFLSDEQEQEQQPPPFRSSLLIYLCVGHFLARWGARMWEFSVGLYMINVWPDSLLLAAAYGVVESASTVLFGPVVGQWVNKLNYVKVLQLWLLTQNLSFMVAGGTVVTLLVNESLISTNFMAFLSLILLVYVSGAVGVLSTLAGTILVEREWVVVIAEGQSPRVLTNMNSIIRRIDLICKLFAPVVTGFIISIVSLTASALTLAIWNIFSVFLQYWLLMSVYNGIPALSESSQKRGVRSELMVVQQNPISLHEKKSSPDSANNGLERSKHGLVRRIIERVSRVSYINAWKVYLKQDVVLPGIALSLLYFTVLSFGTLMTAALDWEGIPAYIIGTGRGVSATIGIASTFVYPVLESRISILRTGLWSIWSQWTCLLVCVASIWVPKKLEAAYVLMGGVAMSRLGLWMFDLSVVQQMQDHVPESDRCVVGGVQNSLQSVFDLTTYVMGIIISNPQDFWELIILSLLAVTLAAVLYSVHIYCKGKVKTKKILIGQQCLLLEELDLTDNEIDDEGLKSIARCSKLSNLKLGICLDITDAGLIHIGMCCLELKELGLYRSAGITDSGILAIARGCAGLEVINIAYCTEITDSSLISLSKCSMLNTLETRGCPLITSLGLAAIAVGCKLLSKLDIKKCQNIDDAGMIPLAHFSQNLRQINLSHTSVTDVGLLSVVCRA